MQAVTQVNARRGPETYVVEADLTDRRGRQHRKGSEATNALCGSTGVESDGMYRKNAHEARETDDDSGGNRNGQAREGQARSRRRRRGP
jgi:hypothetical protein